ncbi:MAG: bifunctional ADP-dependent NAD(P)H-hydrate dehydratase/NAD(P)H-hydrate epimerase [Candidatus Dactylopiibacterium carminicum]|uniref:Bifunctional NAD(P)H-hydrate repair enzyme n=1 Tax=Candidatus Dactylopiibacterium carminicum TaxID=857335 RepID=A0A272ERP1_9RHOO|nr:NAD(P)H-hydrate dehydratase [Candidatus Dactylopiibacterium carminicum]KAF7598838.1 bifunctional ADP-dependent NAD(P)H-hydrate dehydratase/NAD(P)H-hydrate epimerase [Candidatus Dactylopiibacterium carminicum]PAS92754.1 MAG: bifunctional ADP-dependent NAD(P)H-hydrate dehydratase/NAD(P)H-hydrate epimerase [Candidatus Dactylopiibacterium carminicum]PAS96204.1 MAG: bifunctional ADP-dependent NAD(P)H-hydrate dehydratase/NAD(P)H-hydrate epimerase [Candidatus Dactylopiibacterium carminicum]PAS98856
MSPSIIPVLKNAELRAQEQIHADVLPPLMIRAGEAAAGLARRLLRLRSGPVLVLAGPGNNGGDAFVVADCLRAAGYDVWLASHADAARLPADAQAARTRWCAAGGEVHEDFGDAGWALVIDGLYGIGLKRPIQGVEADWIARINVLACPRLALDIPSGLAAETGQLLGPCVCATHTASFIAFKPGLLTLEGPDHCGELHDFDLGLPRAVGNGSLFTPACVAAFLRPRARNTHKGSFGAVGIIGGASGMTGAAFLAARAALYLGPGKVFLGLLDAQAPGLDPLHPELMLRAPADLLEVCDALAVGPGLGQGQFARELLARALAFPGPLLLDADALNLLGQDAGLRAQCAAREAATVITPHPAEAARLLASSVSKVQADRVTSACQLAHELKAACVLKGVGSVIAEPGGPWWINTSGNPGMASGGMGDVLSGLIVALLAQGWPAAAAAGLAAHLHGAAADQQVAEGQGPIGLQASETLAPARRLFNEWAGKC